MSCGECGVISLYVICCSVDGTFCLVCVTVFMNCLVKQFANMFGCGCFLLFNVMEVFSVGGGAVLDRTCMVFQRMCMLCLGSQCASDRLTIHYIGRF